MILISGIAWTITYIGLIYRGFRDRTFGMPLIALALNIAWEFVFSFVYPPDEAYILVVNCVWFLFDVVIAYTFLRFGYSYWKEAFGVSKATFRSMFVLAVGGALLIMLTGAEFFGGLGGFFRDSPVEASRFIACLQNLVMSVGFLAMLWLRRSSAGQSLLIAVSKTIGTSLTVGIFYLSDHRDNWQFIAVVIGLTLVFDLIYCVAIYRQLRIDGHNPFRRI